MQSAMSTPRNVSLVQNMARSAAAKGIAILVAVFVCLLSLGTGADAVLDKGIQDTHAKANGDDEQDRLPEGAVARLGSKRFRHKVGYKQLTVFSADSKELIMLDPSQIRHCDLKTGKELRTKKLPHCTKVTASDDGKYAVTLAEGVLTVWDLKVDKALAELETEQNEELHTLAVSPNATYVAAGMTTRSQGASRVMVWNLRRKASAGHVQGERCYEGTRF